MKIRILFLALLSFYLERTLAKTHVEIDLAELRREARHSVAESLELNPSDLEFKGYFFHDIASASPQGSDFEAIDNARLVLLFGVPNSLSEIDFYDIARVYPLGGTLDRKMQTRLIRATDVSFRYYAPEILVFLVGMTDPVAREAFVSEMVATLKFTNLKTQLFDDGFLILKDFNFAQLHHISLYLHARNLHIEMVAESFGEVLENDELSTVTLSTLQATLRPDDLRTITKRLREKGVRFSTESQLPTSLGTCANLLE